MELFVGQRLFHQVLPSRLPTDMTWMEPHPLPPMYYVLARGEEEPFELCVTAFASSGSIFMLAGENLLFVPVFTRAYYVSRNSRPRLRAGRLSYVPASHDGSADCHCGLMALEKTCLRDVTSRTGTWCRFPTDRVPASDAGYLVRGRGTQGCSDFKSTG